MPRNIGILFWVIEILCGMPLCSFRSTGYTRDLEVGILSQNTAFLSLSAVQLMYSIEKNGIIKLIYNKHERQWQTWSSDSAFWWGAWQLSHTTCCSFSLEVNYFCQSWHHILFRMQPCFLALPSTPQIYLCPAFISLFSFLERLKYLAECPDFT